MDDAVQDYIDAIAPGQRPLFDRFHRLILEAFPDVAVVLAYKMPAYKVGPRSLHVGMWRHGLSIYGLEEGADGGFISRHPELVAHKGTVQLGPEAAAAIADDELGDLVRAVLAG